MVAFHDLFFSIGNIVSYTIKKGSAEGASLAVEGGCSGCLQRSVKGTPTQAKLATLSVLPIQLKLWQKGSRRREP